MRRTSLISRRQSLRLLSTAAILPVATNAALGYVSHALGRPLHWDSKQEMIVGDSEANRLLHAIDYRSPWRLPAIS